MTYMEEIHMQNIPEVKLGIVAVSRDCFPITLSEKRRKAVVAAFKAKGYDIYESPVIIEGGIDANVMDAYEDIQKAGINAPVSYTHLTLPTILRV